MEQESKPKKVVITIEKIGKDIHTHVVNNDMDVIEILGGIEVLKPQLIEQMVRHTDIVNKI